MNNALILRHINDILKVAESVFSYEHIFDTTGISDILAEMFITPLDLNQKYIDIFYKSLNSFIAKPLYKEISLKDDKDLKFLGSDDFFIDNVRNTIKSIKKELDSRSTRVMRELNKYKTHEEISLEDLMRAVKLDKASLLFILDDLKKEKVIYDYNGREITTL